MMYIPKRLKPFFVETNKKTTTNTIIHGQIKCCSQSEFDVFYYGNIKKGLLCHLKLCDAQDGLIIVLQCKTCGRRIELFNSFTDGYTRCVENSKKDDFVIFKQLLCKADVHSNFSVEVTFEYLPQEELIEEEMAVFDNAFSWIWITLRCNICNCTLRNIVDYETQ